MGSGEKKHRDGSGCGSSSKCSTVVSRRSTGEVAAWILWDAYPREVGGSRKPLTMPLKHRSCLTGGQSRVRGDRFTKTRGSSHPGGRLGNKRKLISHKVGRDGH